MQDNMSYIDTSFKGQSCLAYIVGSKSASMKRMATDFEISEQRYVPMALQEQFEASSKMFSITLPANHDTTRGLDRLEAAYIEHVLKDNRYNQSSAAKALGISRGSLRDRLKRHFGTAYTRERQL